MEIAGLILYYVVMVLISALLVSATIFEGSVPTPLVS